MKVRLSCEYRNESGEVLGRYGDVLESPTDATTDELARLAAMGSATETE